MKYSALSKDELKGLLAKAYQFLNDENQLKQQIETINRRVHQALNKPVGFQGILKWAIPLVSFVLVFGVVGGILGEFIGFVAAIVATYFSYNYSSGKKDKLTAKNKAEKYRQLATEARSKLGDYQQSADFSDSLQFLPAEFKDMYSVAALYNILDSGRADNWKEAINKFDTEAHRYREEQNQQVIIQNQNQQIAQAENNNIMLNRINTGISAQSTMIAAQMAQIAQIGHNTSSIASDVSSLKNRQ